MKLRKILLPIMMMAMAISFMFVANVKAETTYGVWDIDRIYIECDTELKDLTKEDYSKAKIYVVSKDGTVQLEDVEGQVKLRGNSTSKAEKRPVNIKLSSKQSVLGMDEGKKWCILANAFDKTLIRNSLCFDLGTKMGLKYISQSRFIDFFYNGVLQGSYLITEPVDPGSNLVDIEEEGDDFMIEIEREREEADVKYVGDWRKNGFRFAINVPEEPTDAQIANIENYLQNVETAFKTYRMSEYEKYIDVDSFVNYYIVSEIFKAVDFNYSSTRFYVKDGKMYAGPLWDVDLSSGNASSEFYKDYYKDGVSYKDLFCTEMKWYGYLIKSDEFVAKVNARLKQMLPTIENMYKTNSLGTNQIDKLINTYGKSFNRNYASKEQNGAGWSITKRYSLCDKGLEYLNHPSTYSANVEMLRSWLQNRVNYLKTEWGGIVNNKVDVLTAEKKSYSKIYLSWFNDGIADGNEIYYKVKGEKYKLLKTINDGYKREYTVKKLKPGIKYYFRVRSFFNTPNGKKYSAFATVSKKIKLSSPKAKVKRVSSKKAKVTWKKVKGADGYIVYSGTKKAKLKQVKVIKGNKKLTYLKKNCKKGKKYYFKVKAYVKYNGKRYLSK